MGAHLSHRAPDTFFCECNGCEVRLKPKTERLLGALLLWLRALSTDPGRTCRRLLEKRPTAIGLVVPGMPAGSPGMEGGNLSDTTSSSSVRMADNPLCALSARKVSDKALSDLLLTVCTFNVFSGADRLAKL